MNLKEALQTLREGKTLIKVFTPEEHGVSSELEVWIQVIDICDFPRHKQDGHTKYGPVHVRFWSGTHPQWIHINRQQLTSFLKRNYPR